MLLSLIACADLQKINDVLDDVANPLVLVGGVIGIEPPVDPNLEMEGSEFGTDALAFVLLADAENVTDMSENPIGGAGATFKSPSNASLTMVEGEAGEYSVDSDDGLLYSVGEEAVVSVDWEGPHSATTNLPPPAEYSIEPDHTQGEGTVVNLSGQDYDSAFVVVYDILNDEVTFDNRPADIVAAYNWTHGEGTAVVDIPGSAFAKESVYALGVCGLRHSDDDAFEDVNTLLSGFVTGKFTFHGVYTVPTAP